MKTLTVQLLTLCALMLFGRTGFAQNTQPKPQHPQKTDEYQRMPQREESHAMIQWNDYNTAPLSEMKLTSEQRKKMDSVSNHFNAERQQLRDAKNVDMAMRRSRMERISKEEDRQMNQILNAEQRSKLKTWRDDHMNKGTTTNRARTPVNKPGHMMNKSRRDSM